MKKIVFLIAISYSLLFSAEITWEKSYKDASKKAMEDNKSIMLMLSSINCYACDYMKNGPLKDDKIADYISKNYAAIEVEIYKDDYPRKFDSPGTPTFFFINPNTDEKIDKEIIGGSNEKTFLKELKDIKN